jgi:hypothetical protein
VRGTDGSFTTFQAPGAGTGGGPYGTYPTSIDAGGNIAGWDLSLHPYYVYHGFVRATGGAIVTFEVPGGGYATQQGTSAASINDLGLIAGSYVDSNGGSHGFLVTPQ